MKELNTDKIENILKYFCKDDIDLMITRYNNENDPIRGYTEDENVQVVRYLKAKQRKQKLEKIRNRMR